ncbi:hypothetical protein LAZ67_X002713 [Cordylochernes scorpioides]|uniref:Peptidase A2 domain-containing protein n=1 Tax=Cordylochernes scorpioides TaxID=51811 RepID=A0ABY6LYH4_9ARAC|nr:hypothetical protein LAZ67_X002713 [Cordylochernes scorpioides]
MKNHPLLHKNTSFSAASEPSSSGNQGATIQPSNQGGIVNIMVINGEAVIKSCDGPLPIVPVMIRGPKNIRRVYALLDTGASRSMISKSLADGVGFRGNSYFYSYESVSGTKVFESNSESMNCEVSGCL